MTSPDRRWQLDVLGHQRGLHWLRAPLVFTPYVRSLLRGPRPVDLLRGHSVRHTGPALLLGRRLARRRVPVVLHQHHLTPRWARLEAAICRRADAVITVSAHSRSELLSRGVPGERVHVVSEGVDRPPASNASLTATWPGGLRLLYLGRLEARKRPEVALEALALLAGRLDASLIVAGDGPQAADLRARAGTLQHRVVFAGRVSEADKWALYDAADVLLFPSLLEGFGLVVAEAQSRGLPVIVARGTATVEALDPGRSGLVVEPSAAAFAEAILELSDRSRRMAMSERATEFAERFDWDRCAAEVAAIYTSLAGSRAA